MKGLLSGAAARVTAALVVFSLAATASASATTRYASRAGKDAFPCTQSEPCLTIGHTIAVAAPGDTISIGPGRFTEHFSVEKALDFVGAGAGTAGSYDPLHDTLIDGSTTSGDTIFDFAGGSFSNLRVNGGHGGVEITPALYLQASAGKGSVSFALNNVVATQPPRGSGDSVNGAAVVFEAVFTFTNTATITGLTAIGDGLALNLANNGTMSVNMSHSTLTSLAQQTSEPAFGSGSAQTVVDHTVVGGTGVGAEVFGSGRLTATASSFSGKSNGIKVRSTGKGTAAVSLRDSLAAGLPTTSSGPQSGALLLAEGGAGSVATLEATNSTIAAYGKGATAGLQLESKALGSATAQLANSIAYGTDPSAPGVARDILAAGPGTATASAQSSGFSTVLTTFGATTTAPGSAGNVSGDPAFVGAAGANFMLSSASPLLERGNPALVLPGELDLAGVPRIETNCAGVALSPDIGAYELLRAFACPGLGPAPGSAIQTKSEPAPKPPALAIGSASITAPLRAHRGKRAKAGKLAFTLDQAATVNVALKRLTTGHLRKKACVAKARSCKRVVPVTTVHLHGRAGKNTIGFPSARVVRSLRAGSYEVLLAAVNAGGHSATRTLKFKLR